MLVGKGQKVSHPPALNKAPGEGGQQTWRRASRHGLRLLSGRCGSAWVKSQGIMGAAATHMAASWPLLCLHPPPTNLTQDPNVPLDHAQVYEADTSHLGFTAHESLPRGHPWAICQLRGRGSLLQ